MAKEVLYVPEESLEEVIRVLRAGLKVETVSEETREQLTKWCDEEEEYLNARE
jgi:hypothetical protein